MDLPLQPVQIAFAPLVAQTGIGFSLRSLGGPGAVVFIYNVTLEVPHPAGRPGLLHPGGPLGPRRSHLA